MSEAIQRPESIDRDFDRSLDEPRHATVDPPAGADPPDETQEDDPAAVAARFKAELDAERVARAASDRRAEEESRRRVAAEQATTRTAATAEEAQTAAIATALDARESELRSARGELRKAHEDADYEKVSDLTARIGEIGFEVGQLKAGKIELENRRNEKVRAPAAPDPVPSQQSAMEADLATRTPKTQAWLRAHPEFYSDRQFNQRVVGADGVARGEGLVADTDAYFRRVEELTGLTAAAPPVQRSAAPPATPPARAGGGTVRTGDVRATPEQVWAAQITNVPLDEYMKEYARLERTGEDKNWKPFAR